MNNFSKFKEHSENDTIQFIDKYIKLSDVVFKKRAI